MKKIRYWFRNVFGFSQREIRGFSISTLVLVLVVAAPFLIGLMSSQKSSDLAADTKRLDSLTALLDKPAAEPKIAPNKPPPSGLPTTPIPDFDPNLFTVEQWQAVGLPKSLAQRIINYRQKGGKFRIKSDVLKIYGFPADVYARLAPSIQLPDSLTYAQKEKTPFGAKEKITEATPAKREKTITAFDLNLADSTQLVQIRGIGPGLSRRIITFRNKLGGFISENQIREIYGLDSVVVEEILKYGFVPANPAIQQLPINSATFQELNAHPYISPKVASIIVDYRKQHGHYTSLESLYRIRALDKATLDKLAPYLSFE